MSQTRENLYDLVPVRCQYWKSIIYVITYTIDFGSVYRNIAYIEAAGRDSDTIYKN